ncbi:Transcription factor iws1 [Bulinus truncatus]|nr:Transcription factor iws1 [Bulinus truncatus]
MDSEEEVEHNPSSPPGSPLESGGSHPGSPTRSRSRSRSGSRALSRSRSRSGSRAQSRSRSRSGSRAKSNSRSPSVSRAASRFKSRSQSRSPPGSPGSVHKTADNESEDENVIKTAHSGDEEEKESPTSPPGSPPGSGLHSPAGSPARSRSRSRSGSRAASRSRSSRSRSRSRSQASSAGSVHKGSDKENDSSDDVLKKKSRKIVSDDEEEKESPESPPMSPAGSARRSPSGSPARSWSGSRVGSRSRSRSGSRQRSKSRSRSRSRSRSGSRARSRSRSRSGSRARSRSRSGSGSRARSGSRSRSGSRARSGSRSRSRSRAGSRSRSRSRSRASSVGSVQKASDKENSDDDVPRKRSRKILSDDEDGKGKGSGDEGEKEKDELIADIFGSSDEDEEFEGFDASEVPKKEKKKKSGKAVKSDDEMDQGPSELPEEGSNEAPVDGQGSDDENMDEARKSGEGMFVSDFELMMQRKKEEMSRQRRKRKDVDLINDNDDLIADLIVKMKEAANQDRELNQKKEVATKKIKMLPYVISQLKKSDLHGIFLESGILSAMTEWLAPLPDKSLPHLQIRENFLQILQQFPSMHGDMLKSSGIGKAIMYLYKHPREIKENKIIAGKLINEWSRPIFNLTSNYKNLSKEEREQRDYEQLPKKRRTSLEGGQTPKRDIDKAMVGEKKALRPGDPGWVYRARVPLPSNKDYVVRPKASSEYQPPQKSSSKKQVTRYEKHKRAFLEKKKFSKTMKAVTISIEGRNMSL